MVLSGIGLVKDVPYTGPRGIDSSGRSLRARHGRRRSGHPPLAGGRRVGGRVLAIGVALARGARLVAGPAQAREQTDSARSRICSGPPHFRIGISEQMLQQIALGGTMIALPIFLQMVLEYNAMEAGLSLAPLSLSMFAIALLAGKRAGKRRAEHHHQGRIRVAHHRDGAGDPGRAPRRFRLVPHDPADHCGIGPGPAGLSAQQLHAGADLGGADQRGGRGELRGGDFGLSFGLAFAGAIMLATLSFLSPAWPKRAPCSPRPSSSRSPTRWRRMPRS